MLPPAGGGSLLTIDSAGDLRAWDLASAPPAARVLGTTADPESASLSADGRDVAYTAASGEIVVLDVATGALLHDLRLPRASPVTRTRLSADGAALVTSSGANFRFWRLPDAGVPPRADARAEIGALALSPDGAVVAIGSRGGQLRVRASGELGADAALDYFGQRGAIVSADIAAARGVAVTGGGDGSVRVWDVATGGPVGEPLVPAAGDGGSPGNGEGEPRPEGASVGAVAVSADGRAIAAGVGSTVQVWSAADGAPGPRLELGAGASALAFASNGNFLAAGDARGALRLMPLAGGPALAAQADGAVVALAFSPGGELLASGDAAGYVRLWRAADAAAAGAAAQLSAPVRWLAFDSTGGKLYAATDYWVHGFEVRADALEIVGSRLPSVRFAAGAHIGAVVGGQVRVIGVGERGALTAVEVDVAAMGGTQPVADTLGRDWIAALGLRIDDAGEPVVDGR